MEDVRNVWKPELYRIQLQAPKPKTVPCKQGIDQPNYFGKEYHGIIDHKEATRLLEHEQNGAFLIRKGNHSNDFFTLSWKFNDRMHHYKFYYDGTSFFMKNKRYSCIYDLVADGLIIMHMELNARHILDKIQTINDYNESPYVTLNRQKLHLISCNNSSKQFASSKDSNDVYKSKEKAEVTPTLDNNALFTKYSKSHNFKVNTFKGLNWCELCANFLWGFTAQGVKCDDCGIIAHTKCSERVPNHCLPDLKKLRGVFGIDLTTLLNAHSSTLPFVVKKCVQEIEARGLESEGLYRVSGFADEMEALKMAFDKDGESADLTPFTNINVIASTLKLYLRLLPVPLITYEVHPNFIQAIQNKSNVEQVIKLRECLDMLPPAHFNCLQYMITHLHKVSLKADLNKMSAHNLSTVFAPTLVSTPAAISDLAFEIRALQALIEYCPQIYYSNK